MKEGYIKFNCKWHRKDCVLFKDVKDLIDIRHKLFEMNLIGCDENSIAYGNISKRFHQSNFIITGTQTSCKENISEKDFSLIRKWDIPNNFIFCEGLIKASSESLSHAAVYEAIPEVNCVIHIHSKILWKKYINKFPTTDVNAEYGTSKLAMNIKKIIRNRTTEKIIILGGHLDGIIIWDKNPQQAFALLESII